MFANWHAVEVVFLYPVPRGGTDGLHNQEVMSLCVILVCVLSRCLFVMNTHYYAMGGMLAPSGRELAGISNKLVLGSCIAAAAGPARD